MQLIYTLKLRDGCYYVGKVLNERGVLRRYMQHRGERVGGHLGACWTRLPPPLGTTVADMEYSAPQEIRSSLDELFVTLEMMEKYGIDKVRGSIYSQVVLPPRVRAHIVTELRGANEECYRCGNVGHFVSMCPDHVPRLYYIQRCAGGGKSWEAIQRIAERVDVDRFIYLSKTHGAKDNLLEKYNFQLESGDLGAREVGMKDEGKRYRRFVSQGANDTITCVLEIATVDSFMFSAGRQYGCTLGSTVIDTNPFVTLATKIVGAVSSQGDGGALDLSIYHARVTRNTMVIVDEAQDLDPAYLDALAALMRVGQFDAMCIGDGLQSIGLPVNIMTVLQCGQGDLEKSYPGIRVEVDRKPAVSWRFQRPEMLNILNQIFAPAYAKFGVEKFTGIADARNIFVSPLPAVTILQDTRRKKSDPEITLEFIDKCIIKNIEKEIESNGHCFPKDYMIITPFVNCDDTVSMIQERLTEFWASQFQKPEFRERVIRREKEDGGAYWTAALTDTGLDGREFRPTVCLHQSVNGTIDINESTQQTRLMSIHAAKGLDANVVFAIGLSDRAFASWDPEFDGRIHWSLFYVALTRAKRSLYIAHNKNPGRMVGRACEFLQCDNDYDLISLLGGSKVSNIIRLASLARYLPDAVSAHEASRSICDGVHRNSISKLTKRFEGAARHADGQRAGGIVEWGDHCMRRAAFQYNIYSEMYRQLRQAKRGQVGVHASHIENIRQVTPIKDTREYRKKLKQMQKNKFRTGFWFITTRESHQFSRVFDAIQGAILRIAKKFRRKHFPPLCPLETLVFMHIYKALLDGEHICEFTCHQVNKVAYDFIRTPCSKDDMHKKTYNCTCHRFAKPVPGRPTKLFLHYSVLMGHSERIVRALLVSIGGVSTGGGAEALAGYKDIRMTTSWNFSIESDSYEIYNKHQLVLYTPEHTYLIYITPQATTFNMCDLYLLSLASSYMLKSGNLKIKTKEHGESLAGKGDFGNNPVTSVWLTLSQDEPTMYQHRADELRHAADPIRDAVFNLFRQFHQVFGKWYDKLLREASAAADPAPTATPTTIHSNNASHVSRNALFLKERIPRLPPHVKDVTNILADKRNDSPPFVDGGALIQELSYRLKEIVHSLVPQYEGDDRKQEKTPGC